MDAALPLTLETERLVLAVPPPEDAARVVDYYRRNTEHTRRWDPPRASDFLDEDAVRRRLRTNRDSALAGHSLCLCLYPKADPERPVIGHANFTQFVRGPFQACYLGYAVDAEHEGKGLMREALEAALAHVFDRLGLHRVMANHLPENDRSARLLARLGFEREGFAREYLYVDGRWADHVLNALVNPRWRPTGEPFVAGGR
jgi:ribosomal-protein-alanine N-acetyltransferase